MINLFRNKMLNDVSTVYGGATFMITIILLVVCTLVVIFAANFGIMLNKISGNQERNSQAYEAAEAGMEFAINYLQMNLATITGSPAGGFINYTTGALTNVALANGSSFSVTYTNPTASNYNIIQITSTGVSNDASSTRVIRQQVGRGSMLTNPMDVSLVVKGSVTMSGNAEVINTTNNQNIQSSSTVSFSGNGQTTVSTGVGSNSSSTGPDVVQNSGTLAAMSQNQFMSSYFGTSDSTTIQNQMANVYTNSASTNYSSTLNGMTGATIWINQDGGTTASLTGNTTVGSAANPVLLIVNGSFSMSGNVTVYGFIFVIGTSGIVTLSGNNRIFGGLATTDNLTMSGNSTLTYDPSIITNLKNNTSISYWAKIPGTWRDF